MPFSYTTYTDITLNAFNFNPRTQDLIDRKKELLSAISTHYGNEPTSILFFGFSPWILGMRYKQISVTEISDAAKKLLDDNGIKYTYIAEEDLPKHRKEFQWVVAGEEYFTFASSEVEQRNRVELLASLAKDMMVTTLRDYKNQDFKDREFSVPLAVRNSSASMLFLEYNDYDFKERNSWKSTVYQIEGTNTTTFGPFNRSTMYFKQLAKFSLDAGAKGFLVHKNLMYKSLIKKNYEHVVSIPFK